MGQEQLYQAWTERKLFGLAAILHSKEFDGVEAEVSSAAQVYSIGTIKDDPSLELLRAKLAVTFGAEEAHEMVWRVEVTR